MTRKTAFRKLREIICERQGILEIEEVQMKSNLRYDLGLDSLDVISVVVEAEKAFEISMDDEEVMTFVTVEDMVKVIERNCNAKK